MIRKNLAKVCFIYSKTRHGLKYGPFWWPGAHKNPHKILKNVKNFMKVGKTHLLLLYILEISQLACLK